MEEKYCERCGLYLGVVRSARKYCSECKRKVDKERDRERKKAAQEKKEAGKDVSIHRRSASPCGQAGKALRRGVADARNRGADL
nr:MAG TPA: hypothetical protein [Caudoviricetes sp.]